MKKLLITLANSMEALQAQILKSATRPWRRALCFHAASVFKAV
jgi:hypothetical protein